MLQQQTEKLSFYMLVKNAEKYLENILRRVAGVADEIILLDCGSEDRTQTIASQWPVQWHFRAFDNFRNQRMHALSLCQYSYVFFLDADEIPDEKLIDHIRLLKQTQFSADAYLFPREWIVLGKRVHSIYPVDSPDFPIRLINKNKVSFSGSTRVHECYTGYQTTAMLSGKISHYTFHTRYEIQNKLKLYSNIAAEDLLEKGKSFRYYKIIFNPLTAWVKWYFIKRGWKDGKVGITLANYALKYTFLKYWKSR